MNGATNRKPPVGLGLVVTALVSKAGSVVSRSEHQCGIWNKSTKPIRIHVAYDHKLQENGSVVADDTYDSFQ